MFELRTKDGEVVAQKNGEPFKYSNRELAKIGKRVLEGERKETLIIVKEVGRVSA